MGDIGLRMNGKNPEGVAQGIGVNSKGDLKTEVTGTNVHTRIQEAEVGLDPNASTLFYYNVKNSYIGIAVQMYNSTPVTIEYREITNASYPASEWIEVFKGGGDRHGKTAFAMPKTKRIEVRITNTASIYREIRRVEITDFVGSMVTGTSGSPSDETQKMQIVDSSIAVPVDLQAANLSFDEAIPTNIGKKEIVILNSSERPTLAAGERYLSDEIFIDDTLDEIRVSAFLAADREITLNAVFYDFQSERIFKQELFKSSERKNYAFGKCPSYPLNYFRIEVINNESSSVTEVRSLSYQKFFR